MRSWLIALAAASAALLAADVTVAMPRHAVGVAKVRVVCTPSGRCYPIAQRRLVERPAARWHRVAPYVRHAPVHVHYVHAPIPVRELDAPRPGLRFSPM